MPSSNDEFPLLSLDARCVAMIRCVLAIALVFILTLALLTRACFSEVSALLLGLYATYSVVLYLAARWWRPILPGVLEPWIDVGWARGLMAWSSDPSGLLSRFSYFALLIVAFQGGGQLGLPSTLGSALLIVMPDRGVPKHHLRHVNCRDPERAEHPAPLPEELARCNGHLSLQIANDGAAPAPFTPRSLTERASALGGSVRVERQDDESTVVVIDVPL